MTQTPVPPPAPFAPSPEDELREKARVHLKKKRDFWAHLLVYVLFNTMLVILWATTWTGFFWPIFPIAGWGIGVVMNAWDVWHGEITEAEISREVERMQHHGR